MKKIILSFFLFSFMFSIAQNKKILYGFDNIPQGLLLNPGQENSNRYHIGVPFFSGISFEANISGITVSDLFRDDGLGGFQGTNFNVKLEETINKLGDRDYLSINSQIEILSGGYKLNDRDYLSVGFYEEIDVFVGFPKDLLTLAREGNINADGETFSASRVGVTAEVLGVFHAGISRRFNNRVTAGVRLKVYSGALNITSKNNEGTFVTNENEDAIDGIFTHRINNLDASVYSSGIYNENGEVVDFTAGSILGDSFFGGNLGVGIDLGFTYHVNEQLELTGSLLDLGFVSYSKNIRNGVSEGSFNFSGVDFEQNSGSEFLEELEEDFLDSVVSEENDDSYSVLRPVKLNGSVRYSFGKSRFEANCHDIRSKDYYDNAVGAQLYAVTRPYGLRLAFTGFYERKFSKFLNTKVTYTIDDFSATNIGVGVSTNIGRLNVYGLFDNIFKLNNVADANTASLQFGINFIVN